MSTMKHTLSDFPATVRQWFYPAPFRISAPTEESASESIDEVIASLEAAIERLSAGAGENTGGADVSHLADWAVHVWRISQALRLSGEHTDGWGRRAYRHVERLIDALEAGELSIVELTGKRFDPGMFVEVVSSEPMEGIDVRTVKDTIRPAVYYRGQLIQRAQIVVGEPERTPPSSAT